MNGIELPRINETGERPNPGSELPKMILNLMGLPSQKKQSIEVSGTLSMADTTITGGSSMATPVKPTKGPEELLNDAFNILKNKPTTPEGMEEAEKALIEKIHMIMDYSLDKLKSIDDNIQTLVKYFMTEEKEEDVFESEARKEKQKQDAEKIRAEKEKSVEELAKRAEELEKNKEKKENKESKGNSFLDILKYNLHQEMPYLFDDPTKDDEEKKDGDTTVVTPPSNSKSSVPKKTSKAPSKMGRFAKFSAGGLAAAGLTYGASEYIKSQGDAEVISGVSNENLNSGVNILGDIATGASLGAAGGSLFAGIGAVPGAIIGGVAGGATGIYNEYGDDISEWLGENNPFASTDEKPVTNKPMPLASTDEKLITNKPVPPPVKRQASLQKPDLTEPTKKLAKASEDHSRINLKKQMAPTVINNNTVNNITNQNASSVVSNNYKGRGALELAT